MRNARTHIAETATRVRPLVRLADWSCTSVMTRGPNFQLQAGLIHGAGPFPPPNRQEGKMNARNDVKRPSDQSLDARLVLAAAQLRFAARVDFLVARWLERCATNVEAAQRLFKTDRKPTREFGMGVSLVVSSPRWDESP